MTEFSPRKIFISELVLLVEKRSYMSGLTNVRFNAWIEYSILPFLTLYHLWCPTLRGLWWFSKKWLETIHHFSKKNTSRKLCTFPSQHCNKFLRIYQTNHLNLTMNYTVHVANCCKHLILYIEMFRIIPLKSKDFLTSTEFMLTHVQYFIYILIHYKLKK